MIIFSEGRLVSNLGVSSSMSPGGGSVTKNAREEERGWFHLGKAAHTLLSWCFLESVFPLVRLCFSWELFSSLSERGQS